MADAIPENTVVETSAPAAVGAGVASSREVTAIEIGLAIAFGMVFLFGVAAWILELFGSAPGRGFAQALLVSQIATVGALIGFVATWERLPMLSLGIYKPTRMDIEFGVALFVLLMVLELVAAYLIPVLYDSEAAFLTSWLLLPLPAVVPIALKLPWFWVLLAFHVPLLATPPRAASPPMG